MTVAQRAALTRRITRPISTRRSHVDRRSIPVGLRRLTLDDAGEHDGVRPSGPGRGEPNGWAGSGHGASENGQLEAVVVKNDARRVLMLQFEAIDRHSLLRPAAALNADVARRDVPAAVVDGH